MGWLVWQLTMMTLWTGSKELHGTSGDKIGPNKEEFAACLKPSKRDNFSKHFIRGCNNVVQQGWELNEPRSCKHDHTALLTFSTTLLMP